MYIRYFGLKEKPFKLGPDPMFLYLSEAHREALAHLKYGVMEGAGFVVITGDVGTGKTTLLNALLEELDPSIKRIHLSDPGSTTQDLFYLIKQSLDLPVQNINKAEILWALNDFMRNELTKHERVLLIVDEAQRLSADMLEEIRLLSNIETPEKGLFQIFLLGQQQLNDKLQEPHLRQLRQRIGVKYNLRALSAKDTQRYILHRLHVAGSNGRPDRQQQLFSAGAVRAIYRFSKGYPRLINILCENALITAYAIDGDMISRRMIGEVIRDMKASYETGRKRTRFELAWSAATIVPLVVLILVILTYGIYSNRGRFHGPPGAGEKRIEKREVLAEPLTDRYCVNVASCKKIANAELLVNALKMKGYAASIMEATIPGRGTWHRVSLGRFLSEQEARTVARAFKEKEGIECFLTIAK